MDDGYRAIRAVIYRDIARVVVILALLVAIVYVGSMRSQEWQLKALGVPRSAFGAQEKCSIFREGNSLTVLPSNASTPLVASVTIVTQRATYGDMAPIQLGGYPGSGLYGDVFVGPETTTATFTFIAPGVSESELMEYMASDPIFVAGLYSTPAPLQLGRPAKLGWVMWKYAKLPFWCGVAILAIILWILRPRFPRMLRRSRNGHCWKCNYDLDNTLPICPECGSKAWRSSLDLFRRVPLSDSSPPS